MRHLLLATALVMLLNPGPLSAQTRSVLHITAVLSDAQGITRPVPQHALLISDNPATAAPRLVRTGADGRVDVRLPPGNYTVESEKPLAFGGRTYQWMQNLDLAAGRDATLELTAANAEVGDPGGSGGSAVDPSMTLARWHDSVVAIWTPTARATGFLIDRRGLVVTNQRGIEATAPVEVQLTPAIKVAGKVLATDSQKDVALLWIDPATVTSVAPLSLACGERDRAPVANGQRVAAIESPLRQDKGSIEGTVREAGLEMLATDLSPSMGGSGGPVFALTGEVLGMMSTAGDDRRDPTAHVIPATDLCEILSIAEGGMSGGTPPSPARLPVEPSRPALSAGGGRQAPAATPPLPYALSSADFDIAVITPLMLAADRPARPQSLPVRGARDSTPAPRLVDPLSEFGTWSEYLLDAPPVLLVRVTPKFVEGLWTKVARAAAYTQGVALPPIRRIKPGFLRLQAFCGATDVAPIHAFRIAQRVSETDAIYEGLLVFEPGAFPPSCGPVKLVTYAENNPDKGETVIIDASRVEQIWQEMAPYRGTP